MNDLRDQELLDRFAIALMPTVDDNVLTWREHALRAYIGAHSVLAVRRLSREELEKALVEYTG